MDYDPVQIGISLYFAGSLSLAYLLYKSERLFKEEEKTGKHLLLTRNTDKESFLETLFKDAVEIIKAE